MMDVRAFADNATSPCNTKAGCDCSATAKAGGCSFSCDTSSQSLKSRAKDILDSSDRVAAGCVHLIGMNDIAERLSSRWEAVRDRVHEYTARLLQKSLSAKDVWFRHGDSNYIIVFAQKDRQAAQLVCAKIKESLVKALLGDDDTGGITVQTAVVEYDGGVVIQSTSLHQLLEDAAKGAGALPGPDPGDAGRSASDMGRAMSGALGSIAGYEPPKPKVLFRPIFDIRNKVISTYTCRPDLDTCRSINHGHGNDAKRGEAVFDFDMEILSKAISTYDELYANKFRYAQTIPVHFETMAMVRRRREYVQMCRMIPGHLIPFLAFELEGLPRGVPYGRLAEIVAMLRPFGRAVLVITRDMAPDLPAYAQAGVKGVGIALDFRDGDNGCVERLQAFCPMPKKYGMFSFADGVRSIAQFQAAERAGALYVAGPIVGDDAEVPEHMKRCSEQQLLVRARVRAGRHRV